MADHFENLDITHVQTPINAVKFKELLLQSKYPEDEVNFLYEGFTVGFDFGYRGPVDRKNFSHNIPIRIGAKQEMWNKVMKEVKMGRYAGPFRDKPPFEYFIQSPIGLVPKAGNQTRLIFHLSYDFGEEECDKSFNYHTPTELCTVRYNDLDHAITNCLKLINKYPEVSVIFFGKTDLSSAFRQVPGRPSSFQWLCMKTQDPDDPSGTYYYFVDKCMPFGASISCALFQRFSNALKHIAQYRIRRNYQENDSVTNYLDDFLFYAIAQALCDAMIGEFVRLCQEVNCPISFEKTEKASPLMIFLGILLDGIRKLMIIPEEKRIRAVAEINLILAKNKATVKQLQSLTGLLNFLHKAIVPGRAFTRRMYAKLPEVKNGKFLKPYHHIRLDSEFKGDCKMWLYFLDQSSKTQMCRPFTDLFAFNAATVIDFYSDASLGVDKGFGCVFGIEYTWGQWPTGFVKMFKPSIEYLELFALTAGILIWSEQLRNCKIIVFCDNQSVMHMVNNTTSSCKNCMVLIRKLVLSNLRANRRLLVKFVETKKNERADALSHFQFKRFFCLSPRSITLSPCAIPEEIWPPMKIWIK